MNVIFESDLASPALLPYSGLTGAQLKAAGGEGLFIAESLNVIAAALEAGHKPVSLLTGEKHISAIEEAIGGLLGGTPVYTAAPEALERLTGFKLTRGVLCAMKRTPLPDADEILKKARRIAVLEGVNDPENVGSIFRSAAALGMDAVLTASNCCDPLHRRAARVSMGAVFRIPRAVLPCREDDRNRLDIRQLKRAGFVTAAAALTDLAVPVNDKRLKSAEKLAVLLGAEGPGLKAATIAECDAAVKIPMAHGMDSLNVASASAVLFWELGIRQGP